MTIHTQVGGGTYTYRWALQNKAVVGLPSFDGLGRENTPDRFVKYALESLLCERRALEIAHGANLFGHLAALAVGNRCHPALTEARIHLRVLTQVQLGSNEQNGGIGGVVRHLRPPLCLGVFKARRTHDREADEEYIRLRVRQRTESIIVFLPRRVP